MVCLCPARAATISIAQFQHHLITTSNERRVLRNSTTRANFEKRTGTGLRKTQRATPTTDPHILPRRCARYSHIHQSIMAVFPNRKFRSGAQTNTLGARYRAQMAKRPFLLFGLPFMSVIVAASFALTPATAVRYERHDRKVRQLTREEELGLGKGGRKVDIREEYYVSFSFLFFPPTLAALCVCLSLSVGWSLSVPSGTVADVQRPSGSGGFG